MPVKIKHKQIPSLIKEICYHEWEHDTNKANWELISISNLVELYNSVSGTEVWQTTLELEDAIEAVKKNDNIFRYEPSDKNTQLLTLPLLNKKSVLKIISAITPKAIKSLNSIWKLIIVIITGVIAKVTVELIYKNWDKITSWLGVK